MTREIIADYRDHIVGEREVVDWTRPDGCFRNVPLVFIRPADREEYLQQFPHMRGRVDELSRCFFWEVSID